MTLRASVPVQDTAVLHSSNIRTLKQWIALCFKGSSLSSGTKVLHIRRIKQSNAQCVKLLSPLMSLWQGSATLLSEAFCQAEQYRMAKMLLLMWHSCYIGLYSDAQRWPGPGPPAHGQTKCTPNNPPVSQQYAQMLLCKHLHYCIIVAEKRKMKVFAKFHNHT